MRFGLSAVSPVAERSKEANTGGLVALGGPLFLLLSAISSDLIPSSSSPNRSQEFMSWRG